MVRIKKVRIVCFDLCWEFQHYAHTLAIVDEHFGKEAEAGALNLDRRDSLKERNTMVPGGGGVRDEMQSLGCG